MDILGIILAVVGVVILAYAFKVLTIALLVAAAVVCLVVATNRLIRS